MQTSEISPFSTATERVPDAAITAAIELLFLTKEGVPTHLMTISTNDGVVELTGATDSLLSRQRAKEIALTAHGVRGVVNELLVRTTIVPDAELSHDITRALTDDPDTRGYNARCTVVDGVVSLTGSVQSWAEKQLVLSVLQGVRGVHHLTADQLEVCGSDSLSSNEAITLQIQELLDWDIRVNNALVHVHTTNQVAYLAGTVGTAAEKAQVVATAYQAGATRVDACELSVAGRAPGKTLTYKEITRQADNDMVHAVRDTFSHDPRVPSSELLVQVHAGVVTLAGTVSSLRARHAAEQDVRNVLGVGKVHNMLKVRTERDVPDADLRQTVAAALARDPYVGPCALSVAVHSGKAYLNGRVHDRFEQEQASEVVAGVTGVISVENQLVVPDTTDWLARRISPRPASGINPDLALAEHIRMRYQWSASLCNQEVDVQVANGRTTLSGTVDTWQARQQATREACEAGASAVNNHLRVLATHKLKQRAAR